MPQFQNQVKIHSIKIIKKSFFFNKIFNKTRIVLSRNDQTILPFMLIIKW